MFSITNAFIVIVAFLCIVIAVLFVASLAVKLGCEIRHSIPQIKNLKEESKAFDRLSGTINIQHKLLVKITDSLSELEKAINERLKDKDEKTTNLNSSPVSADQEVPEESVVEEGVNHKSLGQDYFLNGIPVGQMAVIVTQDNTPRSVLWYPLRETMKNLKETSKLEVHDINFPKQPLARIDIKGSDEVDEEDESSISTDQLTRSTTHYRSAVIDTDAFNHTYKFPINLNRPVNVIRRRETRALQHWLNVHTNRLTYNAASTLTDMRYTYGDRGKGFISRIVKKLGGKYGKD